jgi:hypothetical protein
MEASVNSETRRSLAYNTELDLCRLGTLNTTCSSPFLKLEKHGWRDLFVDRFCGLQEGFVWYLFNEV